MIFGSIGKALFGEKEKAKTETVPTLTPEQQAVANQLSGFLQSGGRPGSQKKFQGELVAPLSNLENLSLAALEDRARAIATQGDPNLQAASEALIGLLQRGPTDVEEFIRTNVRAPLKEEFSDATDATGRRFATNFFGSERQAADAQNFEDFIDALTRTEADVRLRARESDTNALLEAIGLAPDLARTGTNELLDLLSAGAVPREVKTAKLLGEFEKFRDQQGRVADLAQIATQFLGVPAQENITTVRSGTSGLLGGILEGGGKSFGKALGAKAASALLI